MSDGHLLDCAIRLLKTNFVEKQPNSSTVIRFASMEVSTTTSEKEKVLTHIVYYTTAVFTFYG